MGKGYNQLLQWFCNHTHMHAWLSSGFVQSSLYSIMNSQKQNWSTIMTKLISSLCLVFVTATGVAIKMYYTLQVWARLVGNITQHCTRYCIQWLKNLSIHITFPKANVSYLQTVTVTSHLYEVTYTQTIKLHGQKPTFAKPSIQY